MKARKRKRDGKKNRHPGELERLDPWTDVSYKLVKEYRDPITRQTAEACKIQEAMASEF